ncbi:MAG: MBL fold metallo-hydrolase [Bacilli bacterium]
MLDNVKFVKHSCIKICDNLVIYFDPFKIDKFYNDADIIFITHNHYDHYSEEDIKKVMKDDSFIVIPYDLEESVLNLGFKINNVIMVKPNKQYEVLNITFNTIPAYNTNKNFHLRSYDWIGYIININNFTYYIAGDTDKTPENSSVLCDVAFVPIGGTYTMNYLEAAELINEIKPKMVVPIHYGVIVGSREDAIKFKNLINKDIICKIYDN